MAKTQLPSSIMFKVNRLSTELVAPAKPTPHEFKSLSDLDNCFRAQVPMLFFYPHNASMNGVDLVKSMKSAISRTLVDYYPFAGRLREDAFGKVIVECTGEGVLFIEADADVTLDQFGYPLVPHFPYSDRLIFDVPGSGDILNCPLILIQMTRLKCGGVIIGVRLNHCMSDAFGFIQFMSAIAEMAKGATSLSVLPTWERHILNYENSRRFRSSISENKNNYSFDSNDLCHRTFLFRQIEISALREHIPRNLQRCSTFEILIACVWKCHVSALATRPTQDVVSLVWPLTLREKSSHVVVPAGYYGNAFIFSVVKSTEKEIIENPLSYALRLVRNGKEIVTDNIDRYVINILTSTKSYLVSDLKNAGFEEVDFGWGKPTYGGMAVCMPNFGYHMPFKYKNGEKGIIVPICLPTKSMGRFEQELNNILKGLPLSGGGHNVAKSKL